MTNNSAYAGLVIRMSDFRKSRCCARGIREGFERYGADYNDFLANGIDCEHLLSITNDDSMVKEVVENTHGRR